LSKPILQSALKLFIPQTYAQQISGRYLPRLFSSAK